MDIRLATDRDWPLIYPFYAAIMAEGRTYPFPERQTLEEAPAVHLWQALGFQIIGTVPESFNHPDHGLVGLHVMYRPL